MKICTIVDCEKPHIARGMCPKHYRRWSLYGDPLRELTEEDRFWKKVDKLSHNKDCWDWTAYKMPAGYGVFKNSLTSNLAHRYSYIIHYGEISPELVVDHKCHNRSCVNPEHLRTITISQNGENRAGLPTNNTSGVRGVFWNSALQRWQVRVKHQGKAYHGGVFKDIEPASLAVVELRNRLHTHNDLDRREGDDA